MSEITRVGDLEIAQDLDFQKKSWVFQRVGWVLMALFVILALAGLFGPGPLSTTTVGDERAPVRLQYERFVRSRDPTQLTLHIGPNAGQDGEVRVWLDREYLYRVQVRHIIPEPERVEAGADRLTFVFRLAGPNQPTAILFNLEPEDIGQAQGRFGVDQGETLSFIQFVYP
jgi:hypothetical protein